MTLRVGRSLSDIGSLCGEEGAPVSSEEISGVNVNAGNNKIILYTDKMSGQVTQVTGSSFPMYYAIKRLAVRGAPAIGVFAAIGDVYKRQV